MRNLEPLYNVEKPAPGELIIVQGFVNTLDIEKGNDAIATVETLNAWLVHFGLIPIDEKLTEGDLNVAHSFREAFRKLLLANNGERIEFETLGQINKLISGFKLALIFADNGQPDLISEGRGITGALSRILATVIHAVEDGTWKHLKACSDPNCQWVFYDGSKNHSGKWCSMAVCGSRDKARAYRKRRFKKG